MHRHLTLFATALFATVAIAETPPTLMRPATEKDLRIELAERVADNVAVPGEFTSDCLDGAPRIPRVSISWAPADVPVLAQRLDITKFRDGFELGRFETSGELAAERTGASIDGAEVGIRYYWRVLTRTSAGWVASDSGRFEVPTCPLDGPRDDFPAS